MTLNFEELAEVVTRRVRRKYGDHPDCDDAVQEALVKAWKDAESGNYDQDPQYLINRASNWAKRYLFPGRGNQKATGAPRISADNYVRNPEIREKIRNWQDEYIRLHGKKPTQKEIGQGIGIETSRVSYHLKKMSEINFEAIRTADGKRVDYSAYTTQTLSSVWSEVDEDYNQHIAAPSFEDGLVSQMDFESTLEKYEPVTRKVLVLFFIYDWTYIDIGRELWPEGTDVAGRERARKVVIKFKKNVEAELLGEPEQVLEPEHVEAELRKCYKGKHWMTPDNTTVASNGSRRCKMCATTRERRKRGVTNTQKRKCNKGHYLSPENTLKRGDRGRRCKKCAAEWMAEKRRKQKEV